MTLRKQVVSVVLAASLTFGLTAWGQVASLDDQAKCAKQAEVAYKPHARSFRTYNTGAETSFTSHYNAKRGSCFVAISEATGSFPIESRLVVKNAFEGTTVASFTGQQKTDGDPELRVLFCKVNESDCHSPMEFYDQVWAKYGVKP